MENNKKVILENPNLLLKRGNLNIKHNDMIDEQD